MVYHGYENGFRTLGRQTLLEPVEWTAEGWFRATGGDLSKPLRKPKGGRPGAAGQPLSDDFRRNRFGVQWSFHDPAPDEMARVRYEPTALLLRAKGKSPADSAPLTCPVGERAYEAEVTLQLEGDAEAGLLLFYNHKAYVGVGFDGGAIRTYSAAEEQGWMKKPFAGRKLRVRVTNDRNVVTYRYSDDDGATWQLHGLRMEVSGMHHNVFGGFLSLKIGIYCVGSGAVRITRFAFRALGN
jgi:xylan 1,4-beta-xylosidase